MSYGLRVFDSGGVKTLDISDTITRLAYSTTASASTNGSITITNLSSYTTTQFAITLSDGLPHTVRKVGDTIYWYYQNSSLISSVDCLILVFFFGGGVNNPIPK